MTITVNATAITFNNGSTQTVAATGTVSSVATGNGLSGGTITTTGTLTLAAPAANSVGSYILAYAGYSSAGTAYGGSMSVGGGGNQIYLALVPGDGNSTWFAWTTSGISGTWRWMSASPGILPNAQCIGLCVRIA